MVKPIIQGPYRTFRRLNDYESFLEFEGSTITIPMKARSGEKGPWMEDEIKLKAFMRLEIYPPYVNNLRTREFQFTIRDWDLYGKSPMLNQLFYNDPRGKWVEFGDKERGFADFVPVVVTFQVSNHYRVGLDRSTAGDSSFHLSDLFGEERHIAIRHLTSHHLRVWDDIAERAAQPTYRLPENRIYWEFHLPPLAADLARSLGVNAGSAVVVFHKKSASMGEPFSIGNAQDRAKFVLAVAEISPKQPASGTVLATLGQSARGLRANLVQLPGNTVLSSLYRPRRPLEIRWLRGALTTDELFERAKKALPKGKNAIIGWLQIASPARSLGTADQGPDVGDPTDSADFPARLTYAINYHIMFNNTRFVEDQAGIAIAVGAVEVPPRDVTVAFDKPHIGHVLKKYLEFGPGHCTGMHEIAESEYDVGLNYCRYWRGVPLDGQDPGWSRFEDYDPNRIY